jgi:GT2 family glycosyltransferase
MSSGLGIVVIGRNEGERLRRCLRSVIEHAAKVVYVDSGSGDKSLEVARQLGAEIVSLEMTRPFTAARARNAGFRRLQAAEAGVEFVQFVDGDCEVVDGWLEAAARFLEQHHAHAVVGGRTRERHPERSIFNQLCDWEWDTPVGEATSCGGNAMMRATAFRAVGGFLDTLIAGEEPELCVRLRRAGWKVHRLGHEMALHDAAMTRIGQWWMRTVRSGHAFAEGAWLHGASPERHWVRETQRALIFGLGVPSLILIAALVFGPWSLLAFSVYPMQVARIAFRIGNWRRAFFLVLGRFPECWGVLRFHAGRLRGSRSLLIEYK